jgi:hypothetical protein
MDYSVALRRSFVNPLTFNLNQVDKDLRSGCFEYLNFDESSTLNDTLSLNCYLSNIINNTFTGITLKQGFNGLLSVGFRARRISAHQTRFIDYQDCKSPFF